MNRRKSNWNFKIYATNEDRWMELTKLAHLSVFGFYIEQRSKLRIHAACIKKGERAHIYWGKPGAGKSTLAVRYLKSQKRVVLTDELCLFDGTDIEGVGLDLHIKNPSRLVKLSPLPDRKTKLGDIYVLSNQSAQRVRFKRLGFFRKLIIATHFVIGTGLHQMAAYHLSFQNLFLFIKILFVRLKYTQILLKNYRWIELSLPADRSLSQ